MTIEELEQENAELRQLLGAALEQMREAGLETFKLPVRRTSTDHKVAPPFDWCACARPVPTAATMHPDLIYCGNCNRRIHVLKSHILPDTDRS